MSSQVFHNLQRSGIKKNQVNDLPTWISIKEEDLLLTINKKLIF